jgi:hypothetical protein
MARGVWTRRASLLSDALSLESDISIGLRSGEYRGRWLIAPYLDRRQVTIKPE